MKPFHIHLPGYSPWLKSVLDVSSCFRVEKEKNSPLKVREEGHLGKNKTFFIHLVDNIILMENMFMFLIHVSSQHLLFCNAFNFYYEKYDLQFHGSV